MGEDNTVDMGVQLAREQKKQRDKAKGKKPSLSALSSAKKNGETVCWSAEVHSAIFCLACQQVTSPPPRCHTVLGDDCPLPAGEWRDCMLVSR